MKITDEQVETVCGHIYGAWYYADEPAKRLGRERVRNGLEVAFKAPLAFCSKTLNCRLTDGREGGCVR